MDEVQSVNNTHMEDLFSQMCCDLRESVYTQDMGRVGAKISRLCKTQQKQIFKQLLDSDSVYSDTSDSAHMLPAVSSINTLFDKSHIEALQSTSSNHEEVSNEIICRHQDESLIKYADMKTVCPCPKEQSARHKLPSTDVWDGYFFNYDLMHHKEILSMSPYKTCIQLQLYHCADAILMFLRLGVRCFCIDLFNGCALENYTLIMRLRELELRVAEERGFTISSTVIACISPRLTYTGLLSSVNGELLLKAGSLVTITTERYWCSRCSDKIIYVNARFLLPDCRFCDFIFIGCNIQLWVKEAGDRNLLCVVHHGGILRSRQPVRFSKHIRNDHISAEELEDIAFAKEVGINIIVSSIMGSEAYLRDLRHCLVLLNCESMCLWSKVVLNRIKGCAGSALWAINGYDGFWYELSAHPTNKCSQVLHLCPSAEELIELARKLNKPAFLDPTNLTNRKFYLPTFYNFYFYRYPDRYVYSCDGHVDFFYFNKLQSLISKGMEQCDLTENPFCDMSYAGSNTLARSVASSSFDLCAQAIIVVSSTGRMAPKIAQFRPDCPIVLVTRLHSVIRWIGVYHHMHVIFYRGRRETHRSAVFKQLILGLGVLKQANMIHANDRVLFVYNNKPRQEMPDTYAAYKFDPINYSNELAKRLFSDDTAAVEPSLDEESFEQLEE